jgi:hypothetical protein
VKSRACATDTLASFIGGLNDHVQMQAELALHRRNLTLWRKPRYTLRQFRQDTMAAGVGGAKWMAQHPLTLFIALLYIGWKVSGAQT